MSCLIKQIQNTIRESPFSKEYVYTISLQNLPFVVLSELSVGIKTCLIESGLTLKPPNLSCLAASDRTIKTLLTTTL